MRQLVMNQTLEQIKTPNNYSVADRARFAQEYLRLGYNEGVLEQLQTLLDTIDTLNKRLAHSESERFEPMNARRQYTSIF